MTRPLIVRISPHASSEFRGQEAVVIEKRRRTRGSRRGDHAPPRFDYLLCVPDGRQLWYADAEVEVAS